MIETSLDLKANEIMTRCSKKALGMGDVCWGLADLGTRDVASIVRDQPY